MSRKQPQIRNLSELRRYKQYLQRHIRVRRKILNIRVRKVENELTVPNVTRELFRNSQWEVILPPLADYLSRRLSGKSIIGLITGIIASVGSIKLFSRRKKEKQTKTNKSATGEADETQLFI